MPEEEAFAVLVSIMQNYSMREMFKSDMYHLGQCMYQLECLIQVCFIINQLNTHIIMNFISGSFT